MQVHAKNTATRTGRDVSALQSQYVYDRFLARVFAEPNTGWVIKGGVALLARVHDTRHSKDVDLFHQRGDIHAAIADLEHAISTDLDDGVQFRISKRDMKSTPGAHPRGQQYKLTIQVLTGAVERNGFSVDLVTGSLMTAEPETVTGPISFTIPGITPPTLRVYPLVDHVADKVAATETDFNGRESSRIRDLVDLVIIARTQTMRARELGHAIRSERLYRGLPARPTVQVPASWRSAHAGFQRQIRNPNYRSGFDDACAIVRAFIDPVLSENPPDGAWNPTRLAWE